MNCRAGKPLARWPSSVRSAYALLYRVVCRRRQTVYGETIPGHQPDKTISCRKTGRRDRKPLRQGTFSRRNDYPASRSVTPLVRLWAWCSTGTADAFSALAPSSSATAGLPAGCDVVTADADNAIAVVQNVPQPAIVANSPLPAPRVGSNDEQCGTTLEEAHRWSWRNAPLTF